MAEKRKRSKFPATFLSPTLWKSLNEWRGMVFAVSSLYMTSPVAQGGLGFDSIQRGILQGIIPFLLYLSR